MATGAYASTLVIGSTWHNDYFENGVILNTAFNTAEIDASVNIHSTGWHGNIDLSNLHISTQAIGAYGSVTLANGYQQSHH